MRRRPSNSGAEEDYEDCIPLEIHPLADDDGEPTNGYLNCSTPTFAARKSQELDRRKLESPRVPAGMSGSNSWKLLSPSPNGNREKTLGKIVPLPQEISIEHMAACRITHHSRMRSPWRISLSSLMITTCSIVLLSAIVQSWLSRQLDSKGCQVPSMRPAYAKLEDFDTEHTRFASKYSVYLYREGVIDEDPKVKGVPVLFIPGNAGSYRQVRSLASEAAYYYHDILQHNSNALKAGAQRLDFFTADFNEDITAFHGQTLMDQAEYLNEAVAYILSLYHDPAKSERDPSLPDPSSVILLGHSMGGIVARAMLTMPNYQSNSINTIITMSAPHVRPPVSFDADIVGIYKQINDYWRQAYSHQWANNNPLWHVTLISIAGGGLDRMVPSDYTSVSSLVPDTHGFTVFTSSIPNVWTGMEHDTIVWCDQLRKIMIRALMEVVDVRRPGQTKQRNERMRVFRKTLLTGMEEDAEKVALQEDPTTLLTLEDNSNPIIPQGERFTLKTLGQSQKPQAYLLPIPSMREFIPQRFTLISNVNLDSSSDGSKLEVLFCSVFPLQHGQSATLFSMNVDLSGNTSGSTRLACKNAALDVIRLPASVQTSRHPFDQTPPFSYLQYEIEDIAEHQFVAIVDKASDPTPGWVIAEFSNKDKSIIRADISLQRLMTRGFHISLPSDRPLSTEIVIPSLRSGLLSYKLTVSRSWNDAKPELFAPLLRQYTSDPYESKYFVNINEADINFHGVAPYIPSSMKVRAMKDGITLQFWSDPNGNATFDISLTLDIPGSLGKLVLRYRTILFAFPLLIVSLVLRQQFIIYDKTGVFVTFSEGLDLCLRRSVPIVLTVLSLFSIYFASSQSVPETPASSGFISWGENLTQFGLDFRHNDNLLGSQDTFFWFLVPTLGMISVGICVLMNITALGLTYALSIIYCLGVSTPFWPKNADKRKAVSTFTSTSIKRRMITTGFLLFLVSTLIPYQFAYMVACVVQIATNTRALNLARETRSGAHHSFFNYVHSILVLMLWVLPINLPVLVVWIHNLSVHWFTPFSSHHNVLSVMPFILLVETLTGGKMIPRLSKPFHLVTNMLFAFLSVYSAIYGATYAYLLHHLVNVVSLWLVTVHVSASSFSFARLRHILEGIEEEQDLKKSP